MVHCFRTAWHQLAVGEFPVSFKLFMGCSFQQLPEPWHDLTLTAGPAGLVGLVELSLFSWSFELQAASRQDLCYCDSTM